MKEGKAYSPAELAVLLEADLRNDLQDVLIHGPGSLKNGGAGEIGFFVDAQYKKQLADCSLSALLVSDWLDHPICQLKVKHVYRAWRRLVELFSVVKQDRSVHWLAEINDEHEFGEEVAIGAHSVLEEGVRLGDRVRIGCNCYIGAGVFIDDDTQIGHHVTIMDRVRIGKRCHILSGAVIGERGFGFSHEDGRWIAIPQIGSVRIGDDVEVGANTTIDCGTVDDTVIADGVKLDNHLQVAHNVRIGEHTIMPGCSVIAGSTEIGAHCVIGGATVINGHIRIADGVQITGHSSISKSIHEKGAVYSSSIPAIPARDWLKFWAKLRFLAKEKSL